MDSLHGMLRTLSTKADKSKTTPAPTADHLTVFREFLSHLDHAQIKSRVKAARVKSPPRKTARAGKR